ncbi:MAG TPA: HAD family hydrolase [Candidatus Binataceae bacterium]|nr:HAD family hydrolase [Candidatus Binataceae bacterium]
MTDHVDSSQADYVQPNSNARLWLFDFDNTIAHLEREVDWAASRLELETFLRTAGVDDEIFIEIPKGNLALYEALRARLSNPVTSQSVVRDGFTKEIWGVNGQGLLRDASSIIERYELAGIDRAEATPGAIELLDALLSHDAEIAIVTSNSSRTVSLWLERHNANAFVSTIVARDTLLALKPSPAMVFEALRRFGANPRDCVFVGDSEADLGAAQATRIGFYGIATTPARMDRLVAAGAGEIFASPAALLGYLANLISDKARE